MRDLADGSVAVVSGASNYPGIAPFGPPEAYPEFVITPRDLDPSNRVYPMVRQALHLLGLDAARFGIPAWNPLGEIISPGHRVLLKPNWVLHFNAGGGPLEAVVTHAAVLRPVVDYVLLALKGRGELIIGDAPQMNCDLSELFRRNGMRDLIPYLQEACGNAGVKLSIQDFRLEQTTYRAAIVWKRKRLRERDNSTVPVILGKESFMEGIDVTRLYGADYGRAHTVRAHLGNRHEYRIAAEVLSSDVIISLPKLKVHSKVGTTLNIKNMVGTNTDKNHLAHYRVGPPSRGGDELSRAHWLDMTERTLSDTLLGHYWALGKYPFLLWKGFRAVLAQFQKPSTAPFSFGNWHGNDTAWRMALDLNRVVLTADKEGQFSRKPLRGYFSLIDGIVAGQGNGPLHPEPYPCGVVLAGFNPVAVDWVATWLMGLDPRRMKMYTNAVTQMRGWVLDFSIERCRVVSNVPAWEHLLSSTEPIFRFEPAPGWRGTIERHPTPVEPLETIAAADPLGQ